MKYKHLKAFAKQGAPLKGYRPAIWWNKRGKLCAMDDAGNVRKFSELTDEAIVHSGILEEWRQPRKSRTKRDPRYAQGPPRGVVCYFVRKSQKTLTDWQKREYAC